jgi:hypothetical protein
LPDNKLVPQTNLYFDEATSEAESGRFPKHSKVLNAHKCVGILKVK